MSTTLARLFLPFTLSLACLALLGCAGSRQPPHGMAQQQQEMEARAASLAASGYQAAESASLTLALQQWTVKGESLPVSLAFAGSGRALPLIVYLPGLGESAQAGARWRHAWARAGYAVLSLQPLDEDAKAWSSELARAADFKGLARAHQQPALLEKRLQVLDAALAEAQARAAAGDSLWSRVDFKAVAVAGYDLGTQAALTGSPRFRATLLLSPLAPSEAEAAGLRGPLLAISSRRDADPLGLIDSPTQRTQAFEQMPAGAKYLLLLNGASHAQLSGAAGQDETDFANEGSGGRQQQGGGRGRQRGNGGGGGGIGGGPQGGGMRSQGMPAMPGGGQEAAVAIEGSSIAFFDAHLRGRPQAQAWLQQEAPAWLRGLAEWRQR